MGERAPREEASQGGETILSDHPELCRLDVLLLEHLLQTRVEKVAHLARDDRGLTYCMFALNK